MKASKSIKSKQILLSALVALVLVAGYYRWTKDTAVETVPVVSDAVPDDSGEKVISEDADFFEKSRYDRDLARSEAIAVLNQLSEENISDAERQKNEKNISENIEKSQQETTIENLVISKGFDDCVVFIDDGGINIVVKKESLDSKSVNQIKDIVLNHTEFKASQIRVSNKTE